MWWRASLNHSAEGGGGSLSLRSAWWHGEVLRQDNTAKTKGELGSRKCAKHTPFPISPKKYKTTNQPDRGGGKISACKYAFMSPFPHRSSIKKQLDKELRSLTCPKWNVSRRPRSTLARYRLLLGLPICVTGHLSLVPQCHPSLPSADGLPCWGMLWLPHSSPQMAEVAKRPQSWL